MSESLKSVLVMHANAIKCLAEIEAMKAENNLRESQGKAQAYDEASYLEIANRIVDAEVSSEEESLVQSVDLQVSAGTRSSVYVMLVEDDVACVVVADAMLLPSVVWQRYCDHTGFPRSAVRMKYMGANVLEVLR